MGRILAYAVAYVKSNGAGLVDLSRRYVKRVGRLVLEHVAPVTPAKRHQQWAMQVESRNRTEEVCCKTLKYSRVSLTAQLVTREQSY